VQALLAILRALHPPGSSPGSPSPQLSRFLASQPLATSIPFISWLADLEAAATGERSWRQEQHALGPGVPGTTWLHLHITPAPDTLLHAYTYRFKCRNSYQ
jgi:hypothetical protein